MPRECYTPKKFHQKSLDLIDEVNRLVFHYDAQGLNLSLRQLFYRLNHEGFLELSQKAYSQLGNLVTDARYAGLIDWQALEDRGRSAEGGDYTFDDELGLLNKAKDDFRVSRWKYQTCRVEVWVEKDADRQIISRPADQYGCMHFSARGYSSATTLWDAAQRFHDDARTGMKSIVLYLGDHDASGMDMDRYITEKLDLFGCNVKFERIALTYDQVQQYNLRPNPAKVSDARYARYVAEHGDDAWELDALDPTDVDQLIRKAIQSRIDDKKWEQAEQEETNGRWRFEQLVEHWDSVKSYLGFNGVNKRRPASTEKVIELGPAGDPGLLRTKPKRKS